MYLLDWDPVPPPSAPRASAPRASRFPCTPAPVDKTSPSVGSESSSVRYGSACLADAMAENTMALWHHRLGHASENLIRRVAKSGSIPSHRINLSHRLPFCSRCATTQMTARGPIPTTAREPDSPSLPTIESFKKFP